MKRCSKCKDFKDPLNFNLNRNNEDGLSLHCKDCVRNYYQSNRNNILEQKKRLASDPAFQLRRREYEREKAKGIEGKMRTMLRNARKRAKEKNLDFNLTIQHMRNLYVSHCPITGHPLIWETHQGFSPDSPSLDRTNSDKGYVIGNVQIVSHRGNTWKNNMCLDDAAKVVQYLQSLQVL